MKDPESKSVAYAEHCGRIEESHYATIELSYYPERKYGVAYMAHTGLEMQFAHGDTKEAALRGLLENVEKMRNELLELLEEDK